MHLRENWWIWGFDSQLGEDIDQPQSDYFEMVAERTPPGAKIILCASVPTWLKASLAATDKREERKLFDRGLGHMSDIIRTKCRGSKIPLVLAGDLHHYCRYAAEPSGTNFITAGGGGAFRHPTHDLIEDPLDIRWAVTDQKLKIGVHVHPEGVKKSIYPAPNVSRQLAWKNLWFFYTNPDFCYKVLGPLYLICALLMLAWRGYGDISGTGGLLVRVWNQMSLLAPTPVFVLIVLGLGILLYKTADIKSTRRKQCIAPLHALLHLAVILAGTAIGSVVLASLQSLNIAGEILYFMALAVFMIILGFLGGGIWGAYLAFVSRFWGDEPNSAFSAMRLNSYNHFLRLKIEGDKLTVYPIGIDKSPVRSGWKVNEAFDNDDPDQDTPAFIPTQALGQHLIEEPIVIDANAISDLRPAS